MTVHEMGSANLEDLLYISRLGEKRRRIQLRTPEEGIRLTRRNGVSGYFTQQAVDKLSLICPPPAQSPRRYFSGHFGRALRRDQAYHEFRPPPFPPTLRRFLSGVRRVFPLPTGGHGHPSGCNAKSIRGAVATPVSHSRMSGDVGPGDPQNPGVNSAPACKADGRCRRRCAGILRCWDANRCPG